MGWVPGKKKSESPLMPCPCKPLLLYFSHRALLLLLCFKECLLDFTANADQPFFRMSGAVPKIVCLCLKFARSFFGCPQFGGKTVGKIHGSVAVCLRQIRRLLHQGDNPASRVIRTIVAFGGPFLGSNAITEVDVSSAWTRIIAPFPRTQPCQYRR